MTGAVLEGWETTTAGLQETADGPIGSNWEWDGIDDEEPLGDVSGGRPSSNSGAVAGSVPPRSPTAARP